MILKNEWNTARADCWLLVYDHFWRIGEAWYFDDWRGYARAHEDAAKGDETAGRWIAMFTQELLK